MKTLIHTKHKTLYITILCFLSFPFACTSAPNTITPSIIPPGVAITPTGTLIPTAILSPSSTPFPTVTPTPLVADLGQVIFSESFDDPDFPFNVYGPKRIEAGILVLDETAADQQANGIYAPFSVPAGATTIVLFKTTSGTTYNIGYHTGDYGTESLRRFSLNSSLGKWDLYEGNPDSNGGNSPIKSWNASQLHSSTWNYLLLTRSANGDMDAKIWERDKPETLFRFHGNLGSEWGTLELTFFVDFRSGSFMLDEYQDLK
jgi:hypothetical protein